MKKDVAMAWAAFLKRGGYVSGCEGLYTRRGRNTRYGHVWFDMETHTALGVLCEVACMFGVTWYATNDKRDEGDIGFLDGNDHEITCKRTLPECVRKWAGLKKSTVKKLEDSVRLNSHDEMPGSCFWQMTEYIHENWRTM